MKNPLRPNILPWFTMGAGGLGLVLQLWLFGGIDEKGLLPATHPATTLSFVLTALVLAVLFLCTRPLSSIAKYNRLYPASIGRGAGCIAAAAGIVYGGLKHMNSLEGGMGLLTFIVSIAAAICMVIVAYFRLKGIRPAMALHTVLTVFLMLFLVCNCRIWGSEPQIEAYIFPLFAGVFLMLSAYYTTVLDVRKGSRARLVFLNQAALYFCCLSLTGKNRFFYLAMVIYLALDLCSTSRNLPEEA